MNLSNLNLIELNAQEVKETEGGFYLPMWYQTGVGYVQGIRDFAQGFAAGWNAAN